MKRLTHMTSLLTLASIIAMTEAIALGMIKFVITKSFVPKIWKMKSIASSELTLENTMFIGRRTMIWVLFKKITITTI